MLVGAIEGVAGAFTAILSPDFVSVGCDVPVGCDGVTSDFFFYCYILILTIINYWLYFF